MVEDIFANICMCFISFLPNNKHFNEKFENAPWYKRVLYHGIEGTIRWSSMQKYTKMNSNNSTIS